MFRPRLNTASFNIKRLTLCRRGGAREIVRTRTIVNNFMKISLDFWAFMGYIITMKETMKTDSIFKITIATCWETSRTRAEFIKARDNDHALRIANRLFSNVISSQFECQDNLS